MKDEFKDKLYKNSLIAEKLTKLTPKERQKVILHLLKDKSNRELGKELDIPHSTIHDWKTLRQTNTGTSTHISINRFYTKIKNMKPADVKDWGRLEMIKEKIEELFRLKGVKENEESN